MAKKVYAVKKGRVPGIYETWEEAKPLVDGFPGAVYKGFPSLEEATAFLVSDDKDALKNLKKVKIEAPGNVSGRMEMLRDLFDGMEECPVDTLYASSESICKAESKYGLSLSDAFLFDDHPKAGIVAFVDGGGDKDAANGWESSVLPFGVILFENKNGVADKPRLFRHVFDKSNPDYTYIFQASNVSAEILADLFVMRYAEKNGISSLVIYQDNNLPAKYFSGEFRIVHAKDDPESTYLLQGYIEESIRYLSLGLDISYRYVPSEHSARKTRAKKQELYEAQPQSKLPFDLAQFYNAASDALADFRTVF